MMAFSHVDFATPSSPFGCFHTRRSPCYDNNVTSLSNGNSFHQIDYNDLWVHQPHWQPNTTYNNNVNEKQEKTTNNSIASPKRIETQSRMHKDNWAKAREIVFDTRHHVNDTQSESSAEINILGGVSSLVRKWRGFEAVAQCSNNNNIAPPSPSPILAPTEDSFGDFEPDRHAISGPPSFRSSSCREYTDSDRVRVSDIIRKLTEEQRNGDISENATTPKFRSSLDQQLEQGCFSPVVVNSPRIRGRHAFNDLLMQMERERQKELEGLIARQAVTKFSHRGRIQASLRFKFLRQGMEANGDRHSHGASSSNQSQKSLQFAGVHSREPPVSSSVTNSTAQIKSCLKELIDCAPAMENVKEVSKEQNFQISSRIVVDEHVGKNFHNIKRLAHIDHKEDNGLVELEKRDKSVDNIETEPAQKEESLESIINHVMQAKFEEITCQQVERIKHELTDDFDDLQSCDEIKADNEQHLEESCPYWVSDVCHTEETKVGWEEVNSDYQEEEVYNTDWIYEVSRPRSDWEGLRQARYQEMLDPLHKNEEIRTLLGRKSVSSFLSSDLRNQIDRVMLSRTQGQPILINNQTREEQEHLHEDDDRVEDEEVVALEEDKRNEGRDNYGDFYEDEFEEAGSSMGQQCNESDDCRISHSPTTTWSRNKFGHEISNYSSRVASTSPQRSFYSQDSRPSSAHPAIGMELIYDLRRHMEQLQQEMSELRKTIRCCVDMQIELQRCMKKEFVNRSDGKKKEARCSVCCKMQIDSLLYRCGHMCTCFKCAHELQSSSGKCPICRAPIIDVVRTYFNS